MAVEASDTPRTEQCTFNAFTHTYWIDGRVVPSVTQVLSEAGLVDSRWFTDEARDRGANVATVTELYDTDQLNLKAVPNGLVGYLNAWSKFQWDGGCKVLSFEERVHNRILGFAGTLDRSIDWNGELYIIEIKTGANMAHYPLQTAAYRDCRERPWEWQCGVLYLRANGQFDFRLSDPARMTEYTEVFHAALAVTKWKREHKLN